MVFVNNSFFNRLQAIEVGVRVCVVFNSGFPWASCLNWQNAFGTLCITTNEVIEFTRVILLAEIDMAKKNMFINISRNENFLWT